MRTLQEFSSDADRNTGSGLAPRAAQACGLIALAYFPYSIWMGQRVQMEVMGYSLAASAVPLFLAIVATLDLAYTGHTFTLQLALVLVLVVVIVDVLRFLFGLAGSFTHELSATRWLVIIPVWTIVYREIFRDADVRHRARLLLLCNTLAAATMGIVYKLGIANIRISGSEFSRLGLKDPLADVTTRASGLWANPNAFGAFLLLGIAMLLLGPRFPLRWTVPALAVLAIGITTSGSRWPLIAALILIVLVIVRQSVSWAASSARLGRPLLILVAVSALIAPARAVLHRQQLLSDVRLGKASVGWQALAARPNTIFLGAHPADFVVDQPITFSDNGWLQMALTVGLPVTIIFVAGMFRLVRQRPLDLERSAFGAVVLVGTMTVNNANLWDPWIGSAAAVYWLIAHSATGGQLPANVRTTRRESVG